MDPAPALVTRDARVRPRAGRLRRRPAAPIALYPIPVIPVISARLPKGVRIDDARDGAANGVVLDSGDFMQTTTDGLARLELKVGATLHADGDARLLAGGHKRASR